MALTDAEKEWAREVVAFNGGSSMEQARFAALTDEQAREEIASYKSDNLVKTENDLAFHQAQVTELTARKTALTTN